MKKFFFFFPLFFLLGLFLLQSQALAKIGVGVGTGKIIIEEELKPGMSYELPPLSVINTGDEGSKYRVSVTYHQDQPELLPDASWIKFSSDEFYLEPQEARTVNIKLNLPLDVPPGDYFAFLEGSPTRKSQGGIASVGIAAAAKLYFTVIPANIFQAIFFMIKNWVDTYAFWLKLITSLALVITAGKFFKKYFNINIDIKKKPESKEKD